MGWVSGVAVGSSLQNLTVLSASAVSSRVPDMSKLAAKMPDSLSSDPGCTIVCPCWKLLPLFQSQNLRSANAKILRAPQIVWCEY